MTTTTGIFEHARFARPRREHGYCLDDVARALVVTNRQPEATATLRGALRSYLAFTEAAQGDDGSFRNRRAADGRWTDAPSVADHQGDRALRDQALVQLEWLVALQTRSDHISVIPAGGWARGEPLPGFDQQPIEVAALAEACWRAYEVTGAVAWLDEVHRCADWFRGDNDAGICLYNHSTGGCADGLHADGINRNQGAESTLAALSTMQLARRAVLAVAA